MFIAAFFCTMCGGLSYFTRRDKQKGRWRAATHNPALLCTVLNSAVTVTVIAVGGSCLDRDDPPLVAVPVVALSAFYLYDFLFYHVHQLLHTPWLYFMHRRHHEHASDVVAAAVFDCDWREHLLANILPFAVTAWTCGFGRVMTTIALIAGTLNTLQAHCGENISEYHIVHHRQRKCNYGLSKGMMDWFYNTRQVEEQRQSESLYA
jgi:sterol desaturase/sphingolipid hydroxylase (fatty acid hydroxylase superfamily)